MHTEDLVYERLKPLEAIGIPLLEIDPKVSDDTFCIATQNWGQTFIHRFSKAPSLYLFYPYSTVRRAAIAFTTHFAYDIGLTLIALGSLLELAIPYYVPSFFKRISLLFYLSEAINHSISRGFLFGSYSYLRNPWMCFDFIITLASLPFAKIIQTSKFELQSLRGIRIFDVITLIPGVRMMGQGVMLSISGITGVTLLFFCFVTSVAIVAKHIFSGVFLNKCVVQPPQNLNVSYSEFIYDFKNWLNDTDHGLCGNLTGSKKCPSGYICLPSIGNSSEENDHFANFMPSLINSLAFVTHDDWGEIFDQILKATGPLSSIFFVPVIFFGSYCILNLMLIVVISTYEVVVSTQEGQYQKLSVYAYHSYFQFDISQLSLYPLPTHRQTLRKVFRQRDDLLSHQRSVLQTWETLKSMINLSQNIQEKRKRKIAQRKVIVMPGSESNILQEDQTILGRWINFTQKVQRITESSLFQWFILLAVCVNAIFLAAEHANMSKSVHLILDIGNALCVAIFAVEILVWFIAIGPHYFLSIWNLLDLTVVILGIISIFTDTMKLTTGFRLFKLLKFQKVWSPLQKVSSVVVNSLWRLVRLIIVVSLLIFLFAMIGNRVLGPLYKHEDNTLRWSFTTFEESLFMVFWIFTGEWIGNLWDCIDATNFSVLCPVIFISYYLIGNLVIISVFAACLLGTFHELDVHLYKKKFTFKPCWSFIKDCMARIFHKKQKTTNVNVKDNKNKCGISPEKTTDKVSSDLKQKNKLQSIRKFIQSYKFEVIVNVIIFGNCIVMALHDTRIKKGSNREKIIVMLNFMFTGIFILEMLLRWFGNGIVNYFTQFWTLFDFFINIASIIQDLYVYISHTGSYVSILTAFRSLRCLRLLSRWHDMKAMFTGWDSLVKLMVDSRRHDLAPEKDYNKQYYLFAVFFILVGGFFSLNLFVGVVVNTFKSMHSKVEGGNFELLLSKTQKMHYRAMVKFSRRAPSVLVQPPKNKFCYFFYRISLSYWFRIIMFIVICANATVIAVEFQARTEFIKQKRKVWEAVFTSIYLVELQIKLIGQRKYYFRDYWNNVCLVILILDLIGEIIQQVLETSVNLLSFVYAFRILQIFHLLHLSKYFTEIRLLTYAIAGSLTSLVHLSILLCIVIFIYSVLGMSLFGHIKHRYIIGDSVNFETLVTSAILLFCLSTAEEWDKVYWDLSTEPPFCDPNIIPYECGNKAIAAIYLLTYVFLTNHVITNIFVAVILDNYKEAIDEDKFLFKEDNLISFYDDWKHYDPKATQFIPYEELSTYLDELNSELRIPKPNQIALAFMDLPIAVGNKVHCLDVLKGIMRVKFDSVEDTTEFRELCKRMQEKYENMFPDLRGSHFIATTMHLKRMDRAARIIQSRLKEYKAVKQMYSNSYCL